MSVIRGSNIQASVGVTHTAVYPAGTIAGDIAIVFAGDVYALGMGESGWTQLQNTFGGANWAGIVFSKILTPTEISTGSISTTSGNEGVLALITLNGSACTIRDSSAVRNGTGSTTVPLASPSDVQASDLLLYFGSNAAACSDTVNRGAQLQQVTDGGNASGCLYAETLAASGQVTATFSYPTAGSGNFQSIVAVQVTGNPVTPGIIAESQIDAYPTGVYNKFVRFRLRNYAGQVPVAGNGLIASVTATLDSGSITQNIIPNTAITPAGTFYTIEIWANGRIVSSANAVITTSVDLSTLL